MVDIKEYMLARIAADSSLITTMGITAGDIRVYPRFNADAIIDDTRRGFIVYNLLTAGEAGGRIRQPVMRLTIWASHWSYVESIRDRLIALFDKQKLVTASPASRTVYFKQVYESDIAPEATSSTNYPGKAVDFRVGYEDAGVA